MSALTPPLSPTTSPPTISSPTPISPLPRSPLPAAPSSTPGASNPINAKLRSILSNNFEDEATRNALRTLDGFYVRQKDREKGKGKEREKDGAGERSGRGTVDVTSARRNLKRNVQGRMEEASERVLNVCKTLDERLGDLETNVGDMHACCDEVETKLRQAANSTRYLIQHAHGLQQQRLHASQRARILSLFLTRFTLSQAELQALTVPATEEPVGKTMFAAMDRVEQIRKDCRALLAGGGEGGGGMRAGVDIMSTTSEYLEAGYQKLYKWCTFEFRGYVKEGELLEVGPGMREAIRRLSAREDLYDLALQTLITARSSTILQLFISALTVGGPAPTFLPRPIELHAHEPTRYVGDMLAWVHQALANEREFLEGLFGAKELGRRTGEARQGFKKQDVAGGEASSGDVGEAEKTVRRLLDANMEGVCRPLKLRVHQTVKSQEGSITAYRLANLVEFYRTTMEHTIGPNANLSKSLRELTELSYRAFFATLEAQARGLLRFNEPPASDLTPPAPLLGSTVTLKELMAVHNSSLLESIEGADEAQAGEKSLEEETAITDFEEVMDRLLDPMLDMCTNLGTLLLRKGKGARKEAEGEWERGIFEINCLEYVRNALSPYPFTTIRVIHIQKRIDEHASLLTDAHFKYLLGESGLAPIIDALDTKDADTPLSHNPPTAPQLLTTYLSTFYSFLSSPLALASPRLSLLVSPSLRFSIHRDALRRVGEAYGRVIDAVREPKNRYEWKESLVRRSKEEVEVLLGVEQDA